MLSNYENKSISAGLNDKQQAFVQEYVRTNNATQSAITAGYSKKTAKEIGYQLINNPLVKEAIDTVRHDHDLFMQAQFRCGAVEAYDALISIVRDPDANQQHKVSAAKDILDRAGYKATIKTENSVEVSYNDQAFKLDAKLQDAFNALDEQRGTEQDIINAD
ncbi:terminase small subunit [Priestia aryabhattai]|uniref:terminase small subunit n=1 Tax=Priestia aryabhattai TaxID=412384 RepID=UPI00203E5760|nr:terminase small subunit [Priestia aryabhattai]MCM3256091.1 terminase small subunit [Priestia aryabhattai]